MDEWRGKQITEKQKACIKNMQEFSPYSLPKFTGTTRGEAADYISKYGKMAHESTWGITNGYG